MSLKEKEALRDAFCVTHTGHAPPPTEAGLPQKGAQRRDKIFQTGLVAYVDLDERAIIAPRKFNEEGDLSALQQLQECVQNKSMFLC